MTNHDRQAFIEQLPSRSLRKVAFTIDRILDTQQASNVELSFDALAECCHVSRSSVGRILRCLRAVGVFAVSQGTYKVSRIEPAHGYKDLSQEDVAQRLAEAKLPKMGRPFKTAPPPKPERPAREEPDEPELIEVERRTPSLPRLKFMEGWQG